MADYIYLFQNRLTPAQRNALESVRDVARAHGMPVFLAGGAARDLTSGTPVRDLDFAIQGDVLALVEELKGRGASVMGDNPVLGSTYLLFRGGVRVEVAPTLTLTYPKPGDPQTEPAGILDDLRHRDFTANAMAISLNEGSYGLLLDPLNGVADIENRELRLVSNYGFIERPELLLRAARLTERLGWTLEERTEGRYQTAKEENYIAKLTARERGYEVEEIFYEEDPFGALDHLAEEGWSSSLIPVLSSSAGDRESLERVRDLMGQLDGLGIHVDPAPVFFPLLTAKLPPAEVEGIKQLFVRPGFRSQIESLEARSKELAGQITGRNGTSPSETWKVLFGAEPDAVLWLAYHSRSGAVQAKFKAFLNEWPQMRQRLPYALMQEMRITPDLPGYEKLLEDLFFALIDGKLDSVEETRAFLEPYSPPAPVVQAAPRRRPAKAVRSRSRKVVEVAAADEDEDEADQVKPEVDDDDDEEASADDALETSDEDEDADEESDAPEAPRSSAAAETSTAASKRTSDASAAKSGSAAAETKESVAKKPGTVTGSSKNADTQSEVAPKKEPVAAAKKASTPVVVRAHEGVGQKAGSKAPQTQVVVVKKAVPGKAVGSRAEAAPVPMKVVPATKKATVTKAVPEKAATKAAQLPAKSAAAPAKVPAQAQPEAARKGTVPAKKTAPAKKGAAPR